ncbi:MAG: OsmC family protein [Candidatus Eremiobacteraeota bacterium]|nr:OsmC family protein [Candidatus Eremiobacteraeota bacterium]
MDCPYTGRGSEISPKEMLGAGLAGCMLMSMGVPAMRNNWDISGTKVEVDVIPAEPPINRIGTINVNVIMPKNFSKKERLMLEKASKTCPIKHSLHPDIKISVNFIYPE